MAFRAVGKRCAVILGELNLGMSDEAAKDILAMLGFAVMLPDPVGHARRAIGLAAYRRGARIHEAPETVDCSSFVKWAYGQAGIWLPRRTIQQVSAGMPVRRGSLATGDLVFTRGRRDWYDTDPAQGVGHVGIVTGSGSVVHAMNSGRGVVEDDTDEFFGRNRFRAACRIVPRDRETVTLEVPASMDIETSDDLRWIVIQHAVWRSR